MNAYRVANPDRMPRRHLRLLRAVVRIELEPCPDESSALAREAQLLRVLRPKFNRAGTWPGQPRFVAWRRSADQIELGVASAPPEGWKSFGPLGSSAFPLHAALVRLLWFAVEPGRAVASLPFGWARGRFEGKVAIRTGSKTEETAASVEMLFSGQPAGFCDWLRAQMQDDLHPFHRTALEADLEFIAQMGTLREAIGGGRENGGPRHWAAGGSWAPTP